MKLAITVTTLFLTMSALPALAAIPAPPMEHEAAGTPIETAQYRQMPHEPQYGFQTFRHERPATSGRGDRSHDATLGGHCVSGGDSSFRSAFPSWDLC
jgi:hypothetical protein